MTGVDQVNGTRITPLEPDTLEEKFYVPGIGVVLELDAESGEALELIEVIFMAP